MSFLQGIVKNTIDAWTPVTVGSINTGCTIHSHHVYSHITSGGFSMDTTATTNPSQIPPPSSPAPNRDQNMWAMICHLSALAGFVIPLGNIFGPLVVWLIKKDEFPLVADQGKEALNFQISMTIYYIVAIILIIVLIGIVLLIGLAIFSLIMTIVAMVKANEGVAYRYPLCIRIIK
jgi:uncharacterized Tic20 family protein